jgi:regulator of cell morphogenesis and NO signaling
MARQKEMEVDMTAIKTAQTTDRINKTVGDLVAEDYRVAAVFEKLGIDFCCGGQTPLTTICRDKGLDPASVLNEIEAVKQAPIERGHNYAAWELSFLADYIINTHHSYLDENIDQIAAYSRKIAEVHGGHHPEVIEIAAIFGKIAADMTAHLKEEEEILFPTIKRIDAAIKTGKVPAEDDRETIQSSLEKLHLEHEAIGDAVHAIRHLAKDYAIPADVCNTFVVTYRMLKEFEDDLHKHVHLENNILFPKAARL